MSTLQLHPDDARAFAELREAVRAQDRRLERAQRLVTGRCPGCASPLADLSRTVCSICAARRVP